MASETPTSFLFRFLRILLICVLLAIIAVLGAIAWLGFTASGNAFLARQVEALVSTPDQQVAIDNPSGLLSGAFDIDNIVLSDRGGPYASIRNATIIWDPWALLRGRFHAERVAAAEIEVSRLPEPAGDDRSSSGPPSLPLEIRVDDIDIDRIALSKPVLGEQAVLSLKGNATALQDRIAAKIALTEPENEGSGANLDVNYALASNALTIDAKLSEKPDGLVTRLLKIPGRPSIDVAAHAGGSPEKWQLSMSAGIDRLTNFELTANGGKTSDGALQFATKGNGQIDAFLPGSLKSLFAGRTDFDIAALYGKDGRLKIDNAIFSNDSLMATAAGTIDPDGMADVKASVTPRSDAITFGWPPEKPDFSLDIAGLALTLSGQSRHANVNLDLSVPKIATQAGLMKDANLSVRAGDFDLVALAGVMDVTATIGESSFVNSDLDQAAGGKARFGATLNVAQDAIRFSNLTANTRFVDVGAEGSLKRATGEILAKVTVASVAGSTPPPPLAALPIQQFRLSTNIDYKDNSNISLDNLNLDSSIVTAAGKVDVTEGKLSGSVTGRVDRLEALNAAIKGKADLTVGLSGTISAPAVTASVKSDVLETAGRRFGDVEARYAGTAKAGKASASARLMNVAMNATANIELADKDIRVSDVSVKAGGNTLTGDLVVADGTKPVGKFSLDLGDIQSLSSLAGVQAIGAASGELTLSGNANTLPASLRLNIKGVETSGINIGNGLLEFSVADVAQPSFNGSFSSASISTKSAVLEKPAIRFTGNPGQIDADFDALFGGEKASGGLSADIAGDVKIVTLKTFDTRYKGIPLGLEAPSVIRIDGGEAKIEPLTMAISTGRFKIEGTAGKTLALDAVLDAVPAEILDAIQPGNEFKGAIAANATVRGMANDPKVEFTLDWKKAHFRQLAPLKLDAIDIAAKGTFASNTLTVDARSDIRDNPLVAHAVVALQDGAVKISDFSANLGKTGISGTADYAAPRLSGNFRYDIPDFAELARIAGQKGEGAMSGSVDVTGDGKTFEAGLSGKGSVRNQQVLLKGTVRAEAGKVEIPSLAVDVGANHITAALTIGATALPVGRIEYDLPDLSLLSAMGGVPLEGSLKGAADIRDENGSLAGKIRAVGTFRKQPVDINLDASYVNLLLKLSNIDLAVGKNVIQGDMQFDRAFQPNGTLSFSLPDIALLAGLAGQKAEGRATGSINLKSENGAIGGDVVVDAPMVKGMGATIADAKGAFRISDLAKLQIDGMLGARSAAYGNERLDNLDLRFNNRTDSTTFDLKGRYDAAPLAISGQAMPTASGMKIRLSQFSATPRKIPVKLEKTVDISIENGSVSFGSLSVKAGGGNVDASGKVSASKLDVKARISALPAALANTFAPGTDASGAISADITAVGTPANPTVKFQTRWQNAAVAQTKSASLAPLDITASGTLQNKRLEFKTNARGADGISLNAGGTFGTENNAIDVTAKGTVPFVALAPVLAAQGLSLDGKADIDLRVGGTAKAPAITGRINTSGARLIVVRQNLTIQNISGTVNFDGKQATISSLTGKFAAGGTLRITGKVGLGTGFPADVKIKLDNAIYTDGKIVAAKLSGDLSVSGPLLNEPLLGGRIRIARADITLPEKLPGALGKLNIRHVNAPPAILEQARNIKGGKDATGDKASEGSNGLKLQLTLNAPRQIFVRGRGLDAELGGRIDLAGTTTAPVATGGFKMRRGRLSIVGRRLDFTSGNITFTGNLTPAIDMVAESTVSSTTINVTVAGEATNPKVTFTSSPSLPQDEILAQLIFGRSASKLSAVQIAQLADAVSTLAGGQSTSLFNKLRQGLGVDDLDVGSDSNGNASVSVGKYINRRTYFQVQQGSGAGTSKAIINLDVGKGVKLRGEAGANGSAGGGIFFEKEY